MKITEDKVKLMFILRSKTNLYSFLVVKRSKTYVHSFQDYYTWSSSARYMNNIDIPIVFLNSLDDPVVPPELQDIPVDYVLKSPNALNVVTQVV